MSDSNPFFAPTEPEPEYPHANILGEGPNTSELPHEHNAIEGCVYVIIGYIVLFALGLGAWLIWEFWPVIRSFI